MRGAGSRGRERCGCRGRKEERHLVLMPVENLLLLQRDRVPADHLLIVAARVQPVHLLVVLPLHQFKHLIRGIHTRSYYTRRADAPAASTPRPCARRGSPCTCNGPPSPHRPPARNGHVTVTSRSCHRKCNGRVTVFHLAIAHLPQLDLALAVAGEEHAAVQLE